jgi:polyhydroxyalkanoate synthesis regulator phasin
MVLDQMRKMMDATLGPLSPTKATALARSLMEGAGRDQVSKTAEELLEWSKHNRERLAEMVRSEVRSQLKQLGVASRDEVEALRRRVRELEKAGTGTPKKSAAKRPGRSSVKQPGARTGATATA